MLVCKHEVLYVSGEGHHKLTPHSGTLDPNEIWYIHVNVKCEECGTAFKFHGLNKSADHINASMKEAVTNMDGTVMKIAVLPATVKPEYSDKSIPVKKVTDLFESILAEIKKW